MNGIPAVDVPLSSKRIPLRNSAMQYTLDILDSIYYCNDDSYRNEWRLKYRRAMMNRFFSLVGNPSIFNAAGFDVVVLAC